MNWLNRLDDALERVSTPNPSRHGTSTNAAAETNAIAESDLQAALEHLVEDSSSSSEDDEEPLSRRRRVSGPPSTVTASLPGRLQRGGRPPPSGGAKRSSSVSSAGAAAYPGNLKRRARPPRGGRKDPESSEEEESEHQENIVTSAAPAGSAPEETAAEDANGGIDHAESREEAVQSLEPKEAPESPDPLPVVSSGPPGELGEKALVGDEAVQPAPAKDTSIYPGQRLTSSETIDEQPGETTNADARSMPPAMEEDSPATKEDDDEESSKQHVSEMTSSPEQNAETDDLKPEKQQLESRTAEETEDFVETKEQQYIVEQSDKETGAASAVEADVQGHAAEGTHGERREQQHVAEARTEERAHGIEPILQQSSVVETNHQKFGTEEEDLVREEIQPKQQLQQQDEQNVSELSTKQPETASSEPVGDKGDAEDGTPVPVTTAEAATRNADENGRVHKLEIDHDSDNSATLTGLENASTPLAGNSRAVPQPESDSPTRKVQEKVLRTSGRESNGVREVGQERGHVDQNTEQSKAVEIPGAEEERLNSRVRGEGSPVGAGIEEEVPTRKKPELEPASSPNIPAQPPGSLSTFRSTQSDASFPAGGQSDPLTTAEGNSGRVSDTLIGDMAPGEEGERKPGTEALPTHFISYRPEFDAGSLSSSWIPSNQKSQKYVKAMNGPGTVHVRILRAQRLPCSVGSSVHAVVSLHPWKGKVRTTTTTSFAGPSEDNGVCARWEEDDASLLSMVHAYSSEESPVPSIKIDLRFTPLGMFGFSMGRLVLSCEHLIMNPQQSTRKWFATSASGELEEGSDLSLSDRIPLIELEAMFEPDGDQSEALNDSFHQTTPIEVVEVGTPGGINDEPSALEESSSALARSRRSSARTTFSDDISLRSTPARKLNPHLLRLETFRTPATCSVCKRSIMSNLMWKKKAFRCEACGVDCCSDCRLQVDVQLPCGSDAAKDITSKTIQRRLTVDNLMHVIAPVSEEPSKMDPDSDAADNALGGHSEEGTGRPGSEPGVGDLRLNVVRVEVLDEVLAPESFPVDLESKRVAHRKSDYYMRVTRVGSEDSARTQTVQNSGKPHFDSSELFFKVPHFGSEFRVELVDATVEKTVGTGLITTQSLLQEQRDYLIETEGISTFGFLGGPARFKGKRRIKLGLRHDMKDATSSDFFVPPKQSSSKSQRGGIVGFAEILVGLEEDFDSLYGKHPYACPVPPAELRLDMFQVHLKRLSVLVDDMKEVAELYIYLISWRSPVLTGFSAVFFVKFCFSFDPHYFGSLPLFFVVVLMIFMGIRRFLGLDKHRFFKKQADTIQKAEKVAVDYALHRPVGRVAITLVRGRNLRSPELGLPGSAGCLISWDSTRMLSQAGRKRLKKVDPAAGVHDIASTEAVYSSNPTWETIMESSEAKRLRFLLPSNSDAFEAPSLSDKNEVIFPILQPFRTVATDLHSLEPWEMSKAAFTFEIRFSDLIGLVPGSEYTLGETVIPFSDVFKQKGIEGWFHVLDSGASNEAHRCKLDDGSPQIYLKIRWLAPKGSASSASDVEREASVVVQEELLRNAILNRRHKSSFLDSSLGAINSVRGLSGHLLVVQNALGTMLDVVESTINLFNFTDPWKSTVVLCVMVVLWLFFRIIPARVIFLAVGILQYALTFIARYGNVLRKSSGSSRKKKDPKPPSEESNNPVVIWLANAFLGLPTGEDLRKTYFWEGQRFAIHEAEQHVNAKRKKRLESLWRAQWYSSVRMLSAEEKSSHLSWKTCFAVVQGHRLLWWGSVADFDAGSPPEGRVFLAGHAGLSTPSPLELREIEKEDLERIVSIFGRGQKVTVLVPSSDVKVGLERAVERALSEKAD